MNNGKINSVFLSKVSRQTRDAILQEIAAHYGISPDVALAEVIDDEAESLLDYLTGSMRTATSVLMQAARLTPAR